MYAIKGSKREQGGTEVNSYMELSKIKMCCHEKLLQSIGLGFFGPFFLNFDGLIGWYCQPSKYTIKNMGFAFSKHQ